MKLKLSSLIIILMVLAGHTASAKDFTIAKGEKVGVCLPTDAEPIVATALDMLRGDMATVLSARLSTASEKKARIICRWNPCLPAEGFEMDVDGKGRLLLTAADSHGLAYALLEVARKMGVSPWEWWADCTPQPISQLSLKEGMHEAQSPAVAFRGIFINDEDWGLLPWATERIDASRVTAMKQRYDNGSKASTASLKRIVGAVGPEITERIFQLMLRLRMNYYWPPMHECTMPFFLTDGNREVARRYGIYVGGSHCEPMACSAAAEWGLRGEGEYDYVHNAEGVRRFWRSRLEEVKDQDVLYTIGMRGVHDGGMQGVKGLDQQTAVLQKVIDDQRAMLEQVTGRKADRIPQLFVPYKEVLEIYHNGLRVPDDVTLMWTDDNYGYIRHFPTDEERARKGGNALYYHISYWGRPHDYTWLDGMSSALMVQQMTEAYHRGIQKAWILNVGDIKPAEYNIELFMDMAWHGVDNIDWQKHRLAFYQREFGEHAGDMCNTIMREYQRLNYICRAEHLGGTRVEEKDKAYWNVIRHLPMTDQETAKRVSDFRKIADMLTHISKQIPAHRVDAFYQLVEYPVLATAQMNYKFLTPQRKEAYDAIKALTDRYNANPRWHGIMSMQPRNLSVFALPDSIAPCPEPIYTRTPLSMRGKSSEAKTLHELGYSQQAVSLPKGEIITYTLPYPLPSTAASQSDSIDIEVALLPNLPVSGTRLTFSVTVDGKEIGTYHYETYDRSEEWKKNVLRNQARRSFSLPLTSNPRTITIKALTDGVVIDRVSVITPNLTF